MNTKLLLLMPGVGLAAIASIPILAAACSTNGGTVVYQDDAVAPGLEDGGVEGAVIDRDTGPIVTGTSCTPRDAAVGEPTGGPKFCDLPGANAAITVPDGFCVREFTTTPVTESRVMRFAPNGDLFVAAPSMYTPGGSSGGAAAIVVLPDDNHDGKADAILRFAGSPQVAGSSVCPIQEDADPANLACVHGLLFADGYLYYTRSDEVRRFQHTPGARVSPIAAGELVAKLGGGTTSEIRWTHTLDQGKSGSLFVSRGRYEADRCDDLQLSYGAVLAVHVESKLPMPLAAEQLADGFRNPMYVRCQPGCGDCYANELSGDGWSGIGGREKLVLLEPSSHYGYPCCVGNKEPVPGTPMERCAAINSEVSTINLHDTPFGLDFETGVFPAPYSYGVFTALHGAAGSWTGTNIAWVPTDPQTHRPKGTFQTFASGWGFNGAVNGRATDVAFSPDGRLFVCDDASGRIFWIAPKTLSMPAH